MSPVSKLKASLRTVFTNNKIHLFKVFIRFKNFKIKDSIIISSETRGGSTWLMEMLNTSPRTIINWEPLHELKGVVPKYYKWGERPFIPEDAADEKAKHLMEKVLKFKVFSKNSIRFVTIKNMTDSKKVLTKMVRSNLLLPWLTKNFKFLYKPIFLLRHPIAVAKSQLRNIPESEQELRLYEIPDTTNNERYKSNLEYLNGLQTLLERQVALWCIHNMEVINHPECGKRWAVVFYEDLLLDPEKEIRRLAKEISLEIPFHQIKFDKPSKTDFFNEFQQDRIKQLGKWQNGLDEIELINLQKVFDHFGLKTYSANDVLPIK